MTDADLELAERVAHAFNTSGWIATSDSKPCEGQRVRVWDARFGCERFLVHVSNETWEDDFGEPQEAPSHWTPEVAPPDRLPTDPTE